MACPQLMHRVLLVSLLTLLKQPLKWRVNRLRYHVPTALLHVLRAGLLSALGASHRRHSRHSIYHL